MDPQHDAIREDLGAFALGQLPETDAAVVRAHLQTCDQCRQEVDEFASLAGALAHVDPDDPMPAPPAALDARISALTQAPQPVSSSIRPSTARRWIPVAAVSALAGAAAAIGLVVLVDDDGVAPAPVTPEAVRIVREAPGIDADAGVIDHTWGIEINLVGSGFTPDASYEVVVTDRRGRTYDAGAFVGVGETTLTCKMSSAVLREDAVSFAVMDDDGEVVLRADLS